MNRMKKINLVYKIKKRKYCEKRCGGSSVNGICFNKIKLLKLYLAANLCIHYKDLTWSNFFNLNKSYVLIFINKYTSLGDSYRNNTGRQLRLPAWHDVYQDQGPDEQLQIGQCEEVLARTARVPQTWAGMLLPPIKIAMAIVIKRFYTCIFCKVYKG